MSACLEQLHAPVPPGDGDRLPFADRVMEPRVPSFYRKTARTHRKHHVPHTWRTRADPFALVWPEVEAALYERSYMTAKEVLVGLMGQYPSLYGERHLRTLQRRVRAWRDEQAALETAEVASLTQTGSGKETG